MRAMQAMASVRGAGRLAMALAGALAVLLTGCERPARSAGGDSLAVRGLPTPDSAPPVSWRLEPPASWDDRVRIVDDPEGTVSLRAEGIWSARLFEYLPRDSSIVPQTLLGIYAYDSTAWAKLSAEEGPPQGELLLQEGGGGLRGRPSAVESLCPGERRLGGIRPALGHHGLPAPGLSRGPLSRRWRRLSRAAPCR